MGEDVATSRGDEGRGGEFDDHRSRAGHRSLLRRLESLGALTDPRWRAAFERVERDHYLPDLIWQSRDGVFRPVDRRTEPRTWAAMARADDAVATQVDDDLERRERGSQATSSASQPSLVALMLELLLVDDGMRVLEIGTGTGYNAALLAARLDASVGRIAVESDSPVVSVEYDAALARRASRALAADGWRVRVVTGDGNRGFAAGGPYDRVIATCAFHRVPLAWVEQLETGGVILLPWATPSRHVGLYRLTVTEPGRAVGRLESDAVFMWDRGARPALTRPGGMFTETALSRESRTTLDPAAVWRDRPAQVAVTLQLPWLRVSDLRQVTDGPWTLGLHDGESWAAVGHRDRQGGRPVIQAGPRSLWDEVCAAHERWIAAGEPEPERFGLTVDQEGQRSWLDDPSGPPWGPVL